jgi:glutamate synthase domain-containing protein 2/glutamate synthase domain-containing protein 1/glutamate synthase domain-containing protein 3
MYDSRNEHDACGVGFVADLKGRPRHDIIKRGIDVLENLVHRGAAGGDGKTGDGAGILFQIPHEFFVREMKKEGVDLPSAFNYAVAMVFLPKDKALAEECLKIVEDTVRASGCRFLGKRDVPVNPNALGDFARQAMPSFVQCFVETSVPESDTFERKLYVLRRKIEKQVEVRVNGADDFYIPSFSCRTILYKGMMMGGQVRDFYLDLEDEAVVSALAVIHQRYSTNTFPSWKLSQPFRYLAHNGEINTLRGNINQMRAREKGLKSDLIPELSEIVPIIDEDGSDSACLDNALELLYLCGRDIPHAVMMLIPQAWGRKYPIGPDLRGFFEYHAGLMEPWDGPAAVAFTDGRNVGALLDRNGLRPIRYTVTKDGFMVLASETGVLDIPADEVEEKGALRPGQILVADLENGRLRKDNEIKMFFARRQPYRRWVDENKVVLHGLFNDVDMVEPDQWTMRKRHLLFGYTREDIDVVLAAMAGTAHEPVGSMGYDAPLAVLSEKPQLLYAYFKQLFAQVTNPPIDPIREELVMSLMTFMGNPTNILREDPLNARLIKLPHPIVSNEDLERIRRLNIAGFNSETLSIGFEAEGGEAGLETALERLKSRALDAARAGRYILILTDRNLPEGQAPIPALLAVSAVHQYLIQEGVRTRASVLIETGEAREVHHMAVLLGHGATGVNPYLAFETIADLVKRGGIDQKITGTKAIENYIDSLCEGLRKIMSKMGISTLRSYRSAQVFEALGIGDGVMSKYFTGTASRMGGIGLKEIAEEAAMRHRAAAACGRNPFEILPTGGAYAFRHDGERHLWTPDAITKLQLATRRNDKALYREYAALINNQSEKITTIRGMFKIKKQAPIPLESVEPASSIMKRFVTSAMSFGSISREAHETLAIAMNRIGAASNSGEGGEDRRRYKLLPNGDNRCSMIKQVASGRFGVTIEYLNNCKELQIKIAQGAKPGEGGQLPGYKVNLEIAETRCATPGVTLISPPPHHDIYSIEDIKQLIFDLRNANPKARVSVKLVSEVGVGTVAAGVAKAQADMVLISGYDGGTGAAPLSSIRHTGVPWELGLSETQQTLVLNNLRKSIRVQCDGQMKTGRDILIAALLGAEEFGFGTAPLVVCGCLMMRQCHNNTCPAGVATQNPELRGRYTGRADYVVNFMRFVAEELREYMAELGIAKVDDLVGRTDLIEASDAVSFWKAKGLDFSRILAGTKGAARESVYCTAPAKHDLSGLLDQTLIEKATPALERKERVEIFASISNRDRTACTMLSGEIGRRFGIGGLPDDTIVCRFDGCAGQSFAAFGAAGLTAILEGEANDYLAKGLSGAKVIVRPKKGATFDPTKNVVCGNVLMYGATSGEVYINGRVGERFAIRNSGATAVVEGVGDHGCEYMTGGRVVILGETGVNFGAGMSGGLAYVYDPDGRFDSRCNLAMIDLDFMEDPSDIAELRSMIEKHVEYTGSRKAVDILKNWDMNVASFVKVFPMEYRRVLGKMMKEDEAVERETVVSK